MNADKLRQIQAALIRDFAADPVATCAQRHVHLVYAHLAEVVDAATLAPLTHPDFESRVDAWAWPTTTAYEECGVVRSNEPYRDFIRARFVWKERPGVTLTELPANATAAAATAADGGLLITVSDGPRLGPAGRDPVNVRVTLPAAPAAVPGYPTLRRVCLSTPGETGNHAELENGVNTALVAYPQRERENLLHLVGEMPWFRFSIPSGTAIVGDPWAYRINSSVTPASMNGQHIFESSTNTDIGPIQYDRLVTGYGLNQLGSDTKPAVLRGYAVDLSASRRLVLAGVLAVEGGPSAVATHDGPKASWGMNQWTWPRGEVFGEIHQILCFIYDFFPAAFDRCFGRYGIGVSFTTRDRVWTKNAYNSPRLFRVSCCKLTLPGQTAEISRPIRAGLTAMGTHLELAQAHDGLSAAFNLLTREDTTCVAFLYLLFKAGHDVDIQTAQVQWTSFRITYGMRNNRAPTNEQGLEGFLVSLGSNVSAAQRRSYANAGFAAGRAQGQTYPAVGAAFSDVGTTEEWRDWAVRCDNAGKATVPVRPAALPGQPGGAPLPRRRPVPVPAQ